MFVRPIRRRPLVTAIPKTSPPGALRVLGRANSFNVRKVLWAAEELGIAFTREDYGRGFRPTDSAEFLALNPAGQVPVVIDGDVVRSEEHTSELQSLMRISYAVFCLKKKITNKQSRY